jgi:hypothetical protein
MAAASLRYALRLGAIRAVMLSLLRIAVCAAWFSALGALPCAAAIVYDNSVNRAGGFLLMQGSQVHSQGNEVFLAGGQRTLTGIDIKLFSSATVEHSIQMRIFANDGPAGAPNTMLLESPVTGVTLGVVEQQFSFAIPHVEAPDTITWTLASLGPNSPWVTLFFYNPPVVGGHANYEWSHNNGWFKAPQTIGSNLWRYGVRVHAIPEPGAVALLLTATLLLRGASARR